MRLERIALIGFGEVGRVLAADLPVDIAVTTYDRDANKLIESGRALVCPSAAEAVLRVDLVISAVTAAQTTAAARSVAGSLKPAAWFMDLNSASPEAKIAAADVITAAGGRYVEVAVMSPIEPKRLMAPMLLGGPHAEVFASILPGLGFGEAVYYSDVPGKAAAAKLCRSVMIKGLEALICESLLAARHYGVENTVLDSLNNLFPHPDWPNYARYMISRSLEHGARRAEEMDEAAHTVAEAGITPWMSEATARRQAWAASHASALRQTDLNDLLDAIADLLPAKACAPDEAIPGTTIFGPMEAQRGYALNKMCFSFNSAANRQRFAADEEAYMAQYGLDEAQKAAVRSRNVLDMIAAGGNAYYLAKLAGIFGLNMQDIGAQQTGTSLAKFRARLSGHTADNRLVMKGAPNV